MSILRITAIALVALSLQACNAMSGQDDLKRMGVILSQDPPGQYEAVLNDFIKEAKNNDVDAMVALTSDYTIQIIGGVEKAKQFYQKDIMPSLNMCKKISTGGKIVHLSKSRTKTGSGWAYTKTCTYGKNQTIDLLFKVLKEHGRIVVTSVGIK